MLNYKLLTVLMAGILTIGSIHAHCPRCVKIESEREQEQAKKGPQPLEYYDEVSLTTPEDRSTSASPTSGSEMKETKLHATPNSATDRPYQTPSNNSYSSFNGQPYDAKKDQFSQHNSGPLGPAEVREYYFEEQSFPLNGNPQTINVPKGSVATYSTIAVIFQAPDFIQTLSGPFTLFIPSNDAFRSLPPGTLQNLLRPENQAQLANLVRSHLVAKKLSSDEIKKGVKVTTINGRTLMIEEKNDQITVNGAHVLKFEMLDSEKVIYIIDRVLS